MATSRKRQSNEPRKRLIVGISGASGAIYGIRLLELLKQTEIETHLILTRSAQVTIALETDRKVREVMEMADVVHASADISASISSGSFRTLGMIVAPCSMRSLAEIATGVTSSLLTRAADVTLKERRPLVLLVREAPFNLIHLRNMVSAAEAGATIYPPAPAFYAKPESLEQMIDHTIGRVLDLFDIELGVVRRWNRPTRSARDVVASEGSK